MAFHGDLSSYPLPDLLQWLDGARKSGALSLSWPGNERKLYVHQGQIVATSGPELWERLARVVELSGLLTGGAALEALRRDSIPLEVRQPLRDIAEDELVGTLVDLIPTQGAFHWTEDADRSGEQWATVDLSMRHVVFETLRRLDELPDVQRALPHEQLVLRATVTVATRGLERAVAALVGSETGATLSRVRLALGLPRTVVARTVFDMLRGGRLEVQGAAPLDADPVAEMLEKGATLVRERQFDAAALIFASLLQSDPGDRRVREFARMVEREHVASLYRELPPLTRFTVSTQGPLSGALRQEDRALMRWFETGADVSAVVLASSQRELDTLKGVMRLVRMGVLEAR